MASPKEVVGKVSKATRKRIVHRAAQLVASKVEIHSCWALEDAGMLRADYVKFYQKQRLGCWADLAPSQTAAGRDQRLMLLAWFAEVGPEGLA